MDPMVVGDSSNGGTSSDVSQARAPDARMLRRGLMSSLPMIVAAGLVPHVSAPMPYVGNAGAPNVMRRAPR